MDEAKLRELHRYLARLQAEGKSHSRMRKLLAARYAISEQEAEEIVESWRKQKRQLL